jgi:eukaryotic-like serine/threonine-protein kinase
MSDPATSQFLEGLRSSRLLDDIRVDELSSRPEATAGDVASLSKYAQERGWLTAYQARELQDGRGAALTIHGYKIFDKLGDGPSGITYKALHPALQQPVSLRILRPDWLTPADTTTEYVARAQAASLAQSPYLANVLDAGTLDGRPFVVAELVDGCDLFHFVNEMGALPVGKACEYVRQAAVALKTAHNCGIAHGDVSPHTLLLSPVERNTGLNGDASIRPRPGAAIKLAELGLAPRRPPVGELTFGESDRLGPIAFYPPERFTTGERSPVGDVYGLGATFYFLLTTRPPHAGDSPLAVLLNLQQSDPTPLEAIKPDLPPALTDLARNMLNREPSARPSAGEVAAALTPYCDPVTSMTNETASGVLIASETGTQARVPTAVPVARNLDQPAIELDAGPFAEEIPAERPLVEPLDSRHNGHELLPDIQPLDEHHEGNGEHLEAFGHSAIGADVPRGPRQKTKATRKNKTWIVVGLCLHLLAVVLLIGLVTNWFASSKSSDSPEHKTTTTKGKGKKG